MPHELCFFPRRRRRSRRRRRRWCGFARTETTCFCEWYEHEFARGLGGRDGLLSGVLVLVLVFESQPVGETSKASISWGRFFVFGREKVRFFCDRSILIYRWPLAFVSGGRGS